MMLRILHAHSQWLTNFEKDSRGIEKVFKMNYQDTASWKMEEKLKSIIFRCGVSDDLIASIALNVLEDVGLNVDFDSSHYIDKKEKMQCQRTVE